MDNHGGVIVKLMNEVKNQEYKESLLGYFFLLQVMFLFLKPQCRKRGKCTTQELKQECEKFLHGMDKYYRSIERIDFEVEDSVNKLQQLGFLIQKDEFLQAIPLSEALSQLEDIWKKTFQVPQHSIAINDSQN